MKILKIFFVDFWPSFQFENNVFYNILSKYYKIEINEKSPDVLFHSVFGTNSTSYNCLKIQYIGENIRPNFYYSDYSINFDFNNNSGNFRFPIYYWWLLENQPKRLIGDDVLKYKTNFCSFVVTNPMCLKRINFFKKLSKYKKVDSGGRVLNNIGYYVNDKYEFLKKYKFNIAFENSAYPGYTTEKIFDAFGGSSIPIYWGNPLVNLDFNPNSFINYDNFKSENELIDYIIYLDENDDKYLEIYNQFDYEDLILRKNNILEELEKFLLNAVNDYLNFGKTKSKYHTSNTFKRKLIIHKIKFNYYYQYLTLGIDRHIKSKIFINKL